MNVDRRRILVIEDDRATREFVVFLLADAGHEVAAAGDGWEALAQAQRIQPDIAIVDLRLPGGLDGYEITRRLRRSSNLGVIVLTGSGWLAEEEAAFDAGADDYVTKPVTAC